MRTPLIIEDCFGTEMMVMVLKQVGTTVWLSEVLKMSVKTSGSWSEQPLNTKSGIITGPAALHGFVREKVLLTSAVEWQTTDVFAGTLFCTTNYE